MKKFTKIILIIAGSLAALGIVFSGIAAVMGAGWSTIHRKALAGELDFGNWHIGNGVYYAYDQGHGILDHFWDDDYDDDYTSIVRSYACAFVIDGKGYIAVGQTAGGSYRSNYWIYDPLTDLWDGEDLTDFEGSTRSKAVCFSTGKRGVIATGGASTYYYDDTWELKPYEYEEK